MIVWHVDVYGSMRVHFLAEAELFARWTTTTLLTVAAAAAVTGRHYR